MQTFGEQLKKARTRVKMSQSKLGRQTGLATTAICNLEYGHTHPKLETVIKIVWALKVEFEFEHGGKRIVVRQDGLAPKPERLE
jgi:predicted transcriptional regulator